MKIIEAYVHSSPNSLSMTGEKYLNPVKFA